MSRLLHVADSHLSERKRLSDNIEIHKEIVRIAKDRKVDAIVHSGDFFDTRSTPAERNALADFLIAASSVAPVFGVRGNHDVDEDLDIFNRLDSAYPICIDERPTMPGEAAVLGPFAFLALPWFTKAHLVARLEAETSGEDSTARTIEAARSLLTGLQAEAARLRAAGAIPILVGHLHVGGSVVSTGQILIGGGVELSPGDLADVGADYVALGHIHAAQEWNGGRISYSGSPQRHDFGEDEPKGVRIIEIEARGGFSSEFVELPARKIVLLEWDFTDGKIDWGRLESLRVSDVCWALVRVRYRIRPEDLHLLDEAPIENILSTDCGAHSVKLEAVLVHSDRIRSEAIVTADGTFEELCAFWSSKSIDVPEAQRERVRAKLDLIEQGQRGELAPSSATPILDRLHSMVERRAGGAA
jgi:exonuclease SbcD